SLSDEAALRAAGDATLAAGLSDEATARAAFDAGAITGVSVATGLTGGGTAGDVSVGWDASAIQARVSGSCASGSAIRQVDATGAVTCQPMTENTDSQTLSLSGFDLSISGGNTVTLPTVTPGLADVLGAGNDGGGADAVDVGGVVGVAAATATAEQDGTSDRADKVYLPYAGTPIWQSFTAEATGLLTQVDLHHYTGELTDATISIYAGEGASGTPLLSDHIGARAGGGWQSYVLSTPVPVMRGLKYTVRMVDVGGQWQWEFYSGAAGDTYLGGRASTKAIEDMRFKTFVIPAPGVDFAAGDVAVLGSALRPAVDAATDLGTTDHRWRTVYAADGVIQTSDARLKCNIHDSPYGLHEVMALRPVAYHWKSGQGAQMLGFLAQEVAPVVPEAVVGGPAEGRAYGMNYTELLPVVTKAIQEQQAQLEEQRRLIATQRQLLDLQSDKLSRLEAELERLREATGR
ncbi:MAG: tail fiber domain-containing protein, partial [Deltaproteobacteria bacterium]